MSKWFAISKEDIGKEFKVLQSFSLHGMKSLGNYSWQGTRKELKENDLITYLGMKQGWGSDNIPQHNFEFDGFSGEVGGDAAPFELWGSISLGFIERKKDD